MALEKEFGSKISFIIIDVETTSDPTMEEMAKLFEVRYIPAVFFINKEGELEDQHVGLMGEEDLRERMDKIAN